LTFFLEHHRLSSGPAYNSNCSLEIMINKALKQVRLFHRLKQNELAEQLEISTSYLSEIESGKKPASLELLGKYSDIFSIPASSLLLFSENLSSDLPSDKIRIKFTKKILKIMEWVNDGDQIKEKA